MENKTKISIVVGLLVVVAIAAAVLLSGCVEKSQEQITKEQAIQIANATEEAQEFLKLYPDTNVEASEFGSRCDATSCYGSWLWTVLYYPSSLDLTQKEKENIVYDVVDGIRYDRKKDIDLPVQIIAIDFATGEIFGKYPELEYLTSSKYCEQDSDCKCSQGGCSCENFVYGGRKIEIECFVALCGSDSDCRCQNNACTAVKKPSTKEQNCINSGGTVSTSLCCQSAGDFPNTCLIGACGCAPDYSHEVKTCDCGGDNCFDGDKCVPFGAL